MKTKSDLLQELRDAEVMYHDSINAGNYVIAASAAGYMAALCRKLQPAALPPQSLRDICQSLNKLGALLEQGGANVVHVE
jgi:hypothetical protein